MNPKDDNALPVASDAAQGKFKIELKRKLVPITRKEDINRYWESLFELLGGPIEDFIKRKEGK